MSGWRPNIDIVLSDSEDEEEAVNYHGRDAILVVVDANLSATPDLFAETLKLVQDAFISGIILNDKDLMGVMFANTEHSPEPLEPKCLDNICMPNNCAVFLPLRQLTKPIAEHLLDFIRTAPENFKKEYGAAPNSVKFADMIRLTVDLFKDCGYSLNSANIVYLTDQTLPHAPDTHDHQRALQKGKDLEGQDIDFTLIPMVDDFDYEPFYKEFLTLAGFDPGSIGMRSAQHAREILRDRKLQQNFLKRSLGHFEFTIGPNTVISAQFYNYYRRNIYPHKVTMLRKSNEVVQRKQVIMLREQDEETMEATERVATIKELHYEIKLGGKAIRLTRETLERVRNLHSPGMMLMGFKPLDSLPEQWYNRPCNFMYPDDKTIAGSKRLFAALWQRCLEREKLAICLFMSRRRSNPRYVALVPVTINSATDAASNSGCPSLIQGDGFKIIYLPMAKHIRHGGISHFAPLEEPVPPEGDELFEKLIHKLRIYYKPNMIHDPRLKQLQDNLLALALDIEPEAVAYGDDEQTIAQQDERIAELLPSMKNIFGVDEEKVAKRRAPAKAEGDAATAARVKKPKVDTLSLEEVRSLAELRKLNTMTVAEVRAALLEHFDFTMPKSATKKRLLLALHSRCT